MVYKYLLANNYESIFEQGCKTTQAMNLGCSSIILQQQSIFLLVWEISQVVASWYPQNKFAMQNSQYSLKQNILIRTSAAQHIISMMCWTVV